MNRRSRKRLPWTYFDSLGWGGKRVDEDKARAIVRRVGLEATSELGETPLTVAAELGRVEMVRWLLDAGADVEDVAPQKHFRPALCAAAYGKRPEVAAMLINAGANLEACDSHSNTPLANAFVNCFCDPQPLASLLIANGAVVTERVRKLGERWNAASFKTFLLRMNPCEKLNDTTEKVAAPDQKRIP